MTTENTQEHDHGLPEMTEREHDMIHRLHHAMVENDNLRFMNFVSRRALEKLMPDVNDRIEIDLSDVPEGSLPIEDGVTIKKLIVVRLASGDLDLQPVL